jgi:formylglycine-generating enzyme required for sulfatase activity
MGWEDSRFQGTGKPVEQVTWYDAVSYCNQRSTREGCIPVCTITGVTMDGSHITYATVTWNQAANGYRLLTEAEWEYACRATSTTAFCSGAITDTYCSPLDPNLDHVGWYCGNASDTTHDCGGKTANAWGLKDMHGNVWEWCWDWYGDYAGDATDPPGPPSGSYRVIRGESYFSLSHALRCHCATREYTYPSIGFSTFGGNVVGLRLARTSP